MSSIALIGGTGLGRLDGMEVTGERDPQTPWGECSQPVQSGRFEGAEVHFIPRHGEPRRIPPHRVNYRANLWALRNLGASRVVAVNVVGAMRDSMPPGHVVIPDQIVDYTWGRAHTFSDDMEEAPVHIDFTHPYDPQLRRELIAAAQSLGIDFTPTATYAATQGPRLETAAEVRRLARDGCDVVGMTGMPEAALAAELGLRYASVCLVVNPAAGLGDGPIDEAAMGAVLERNMPLIAALLGRWVRPE